MNPSLTSTVDEVRVFAGGRTLRAKRIILRDGHKTIGIGYVDCCLLGRWPKIIQEETELIAALFAHK